MWGVYRALCSVAVAAFGGVSRCERAVPGIVIHCEAEKSVGTGNIHGSCAGMVSLGWLSVAMQAQQ